ncbi:MAG: hypothetical protein BWY09_00369 [Candidatus Hydrogenedentes bacterium ADurb.Bin179]|nr:MAG: hypothetical protein BWY09_00369 [Candidatus Hydrogenedentes bacterium ADurb.Bin179]
MDRIIGDRSAQRGGVDGEHAKVSVFQRGILRPVERKNQWSIHDCGAACLRYPAFDQSKRHGETDVHNIAGLPLPIKIQESARCVFELMGRAVNGNLRFCRPSRHAQL